MLAFFITYRKDTVALDKKGKKQLTSASVAMVHSVPELIVSEEVCSNYLWLLSEVNECL